MNVAWTKQRKPSFGSRHYDRRYWSRMGAKTALDLPLFGPGPGGGAKDYSPQGTDASQIVAAGSKISYASTPWGEAVYLQPATANEKTCLKAVPKLTVSGSWSVLCEFVLPTLSGGSLSGGAELISTRDGSDTSFDIQVNVGSNLIHSDIGTGSAWLSTAADASVTWASNKRYQAIYSVFETGYRIYLNGLKIGSGSWSAAVPMFCSPSAPIFLGQLNTNGGVNFYGQYLQVAILLGAVNDQQAYQLANRPWPRFSRRQAVVGVSAAPAGGQLLLLRRRAAA